MLRRMIRFALPMAMLPVLALAQAGPRITGVEPTAAKVGANCTIIGENLDTDTVAAVLLSDDEKDYPAEVVQGSADRIVVKIPDVAPGSYNISLKIGNGIYIQPVRLTVEQ